MTNSDDPQISRFEFLPCPRLEDIVIGTLPRSISELLTLPPLDAERTVDYSKQGLCDVYSFTSEETQDG